MISKKEVYEYVWSLFSTDDLRRESRCSRGRRDRRYASRCGVDVDYIQRELDRRRPGQSRITTPRSEGDRVELLSGVFEGRTTGCPIGFVVRNEQQHSADYDNLRDVFRPSHADFTYQMKYGVRDHRGGGRSSARETISRVVGGAFAKLLLADWAWTSRLGRDKWGMWCSIEIITNYASIRLKRTPCAVPMSKWRRTWSV